MQGWLFPAAMGLDEARRTARAIEMGDEVFRSVAPCAPVHYEAGELKILVVDAGAKDNIVRSLLERGASVIRAPYHACLAELAVGTDGILIGNGPGDPKDLKLLIEQVRGCSEATAAYGVCLGNRSSTLAAGARNCRTGTRVSQPVQDLLTRRCYVTSQNHGYAVRRPLPPIRTVVREHQRRRERRHPLSVRPPACSSIPRPRDTGTCSMIAPSVRWKA
jgi:carbamoyl-phosphate synthase small subunit